MLAREVVKSNLVHKAFGGAAEACRRGLLLLERRLNHSVEALVGFGRDLVPALALGKRELLPGCALIDLACGLVHF